MDYIRCRCCGAKLYDGDPALCNGPVDFYSTYCMDCRDEFFESVRDTINFAYGYEDEEGMLWMYDENSTVYRDLDDFIEAEADIGSSETKAMLAAIEERALEWKLLGAYSCLKD